MCGRVKEGPWETEMEEEGGTLCSPWMVAGGERLEVGEEFQTTEPI